MLTVQLEPDLIDQIDWLVGNDNVAAQIFVNDAVRSRVREARQQKIEAELQHFADNHAQWRRTFYGEYVAVHHGQIVDHDKNLRTLRLRVSAQYGSTPILLKRVTEEIERVISVRPKRLFRPNHSTTITE